MTDYNNAKDIITIHLAKQKNENKNKKKNGKADYERRKMNSKKRMFGTVFKLATKVQDATATMAAHKNSFTGCTRYHTSTQTPIVLDMSDSQTYN